MMIIYRIIFSIILVQMTGYIKACAFTYGYNEQFNVTIFKDNLEEKDENSTHKQMSLLIMFLSAMALILVLLLYCLDLNRREKKIQRINAEQNIIRDNTNDLIQSNYTLSNMDLNISLFTTSSCDYQDNELQITRLNSVIPSCTIPLSFNLNNNIERDPSITPLLSSLSVDDEPPSYEEAMKMYH